MLRVRDGDIDKLGVLFDRHHKLLFNFFLRLTSSREASEDLVQDVFFRMLKYRYTYRGNSQFSFWMFQIARNARIDYFRKKREVSCGEDLDTVADEDLIVSDDLVRDEDSRLLHLALNKLPVGEREVLLLSRFKEIKYKKIAELLGCAEGTVKARVHHAIKNLRDIFQDMSGERAL